MTLSIPVYISSPHEYYSTIRSIYSLYVFVPGVENQTTWEIRDFLIVVVVQYEYGVFPSLGTQGFGVAAKSTQECRHADPTAVVAFHQTDIGEYLRSEEMLI